MKTPKTENSVRSIYIPETICTALEAARQVQQALKADLGPEYQDFNLVIAQNNGRPVEERIIAEKMRTLIADHRLRPVVFHSLRHSSTSLKLRISGGDIKAVQGDTGHAQANMVTDVYSHIMDDDRKRLAQQVDSDFFSSTEKAKTQPSADDPVGQLMRLVETSPDIAGLLLQMTQVLGAKAAVV